MDDKSSAITDKQTPAPPPETTSEENPGGAPAKSAPSAPEPADSKRRAGRGGRVLLVLCLLVLLGGLGYTGWQLVEQRQEIAMLFDSQNAVQNRSDAVERQVSSDTGVLTSRIDSLQAELDEAREMIAGQESLLTEQQAELQRMNDQLVSAALRQREQETGVSLAWRLAEVEGLLSLAQQHLLVTKDGDTAIALMQSADAILDSLNDANVFPVRTAISRDIASIRGMDSVDLEGIYLRLGALSDAVNTLVVHDDLRDQLATATETDPGNGRLAGMVRAFRDVFGVQVRRLDAPLDPMLTPEQAFALKSRVQLLIEQAQQAARAGDQSVYTSALGQAASLLASSFEDDSSTTSVINALGDMQGENVVAAVPAANTGLIASRQLLAAFERGAAGGESAP